MKKNEEEMERKKGEKKMEKGEGEGGGGKGGDGSIHNVCFSLILAWGLGKSAFKPSDATSASLFSVDDLACI